MCRGTAGPFRGTSMPRSAVPRSVLLLRLPRRLVQRVRQRSACGFVFESAKFQRSVGGKAHTGSGIAPLRPSAWCGYDVLAGGTGATCSGTVFSLCRGVIVLWLYRGDIEF